jgi:hypothetical protein
MSRKTFYNENQLTLPFSQGRSRAISYDSRERAFWLLVLGSLLSLAVYVYAINATAHNIAMRQHLEREVAQHRAELGTLEFERIAQKNAVTLEVAQAYGFSEVARPLYVARGGSTSALSFNTKKP